MTVLERLRNTDNTAEKKPPRLSYVPMPNAADPGRAALRAVLFVLGLYILMPPELRYEGFGGSLGRPATIGGLSLAAWWALTRLVPSQTISGRQPVRTAAILYGIAFLLAVAATSNRLLQPVEQRGLDRQIFAQIALLGLLLATVDGLRNWRQVQSFSRGLAYFGGVLGVVGFIQWITETSVANWYAFTGLSLAVEREFRARGADDLQRVQSVLGHPIEFGVVMGMLLPLTLHFALYAKKNQLFWWGLVGLNGLMVLLPVSRSSILTVGLGMAVATTAWPWIRRLQLAAVGFLAIVAVRVLIPGLVGTIFSLFRDFGQDDSIKGRLEDYDAIGEFAEGHAIFGRGPGTWVTAELDYFTLDNQWLLTLLELGLLGVVACAAIYLSGIICGFRAAQLAPTSESTSLIKALTGGIVGALGASFTFDSIAFTGHMAITFVFIGVAGACWRIATRGEIPADPAEQLSA